MICPFCKEEIKDGAIKCKHCGSTITEDSLSGSAVMQSGKNKIAAGIFALLLGGFGVHKFYLGRIGWGILYLIFAGHSYPHLSDLSRAYFISPLPMRSSKKKYVRRK